MSNYKTKFTELGTALLNLSNYLLIIILVVFLGLKLLKLINLYFIVSTNITNENIITPWQ